MFMGSTTNALGSKSQSVLDLKLAQSQRNDAESNYAKEYEWLYGDDTEELQENTQVKSSYDDEECRFDYSPTDCLFFHQFIALHQESPQLVRTTSSFDDEIVSINSYLNELNERQVESSDKNEVL